MRSRAINPDPESPRRVLAVGRVRAEYDPGAMRDVSMTVVLVDNGGEVGYARGRFYTDGHPQPALGEAILAAARLKETS